MPEEQHGLIQMKTSSFPLECTTHSYNRVSAKILFNKVYHNACHRIGTQLIIAELMYG